MRPWSDPLSEAFSDRVEEITLNTLANNEQALSVLRGLAAGSIHIPPANRLGRPAAVAAESLPIPVRTHYMVGNHDWFFHLRGSRATRLRQTVAERMGLATSPLLPFPHDPRDSEDLLRVLRRHQVVARHGDLYDPFNFEGRRDSSSLGDAIVIELLSRFSRQIELEMGDDLPTSTFLGLRELDNIRPLLLVPVWIDGLLEKTCPHLPAQQQVKRTWDRLADEFLELSFVRDRDTWCPLDMVDGLQRALKFSRAVSIDWASSIARWMFRLRGASSTSYVEHALAEQDFRNRRARHVVYGHTHQAETVPLDASSAEGYVLNQTYFNSGTWRRVHEQTRMAPGEREFIAADTLTYLAFFAGTERRGRPFETWSGTLGLAPSPQHNYRVDSGAPRDAAGEPVPSSDLSLGRPHFHVVRSEDGIPAAP